MVLPSWRTSRDEVFRGTGSAGAWTAVTGLLLAGETQNAWGPGGGRVPRHGISTLLGVAEDLVPLVKVGLAVGHGVGVLHPVDLAGINGGEGHAHDGGRCHVGTDRVFADLREDLLALFGKVVVHE